MQASRDDFVSTAQDADIFFSLMMKLLAAAISATDYYAAVKSKLATASPLLGETNDGEAKPSPALAFSHMKACIEIGNLSWAGEVINKLIDVSSYSAITAQIRAETVLLPLVPLLQDWDITGGFSAIPAEESVGYPATWITSLLLSAIEVTDCFIPRTVLDPTPTGHSVQGNGRQVWEQIPNPALGLLHIRSCLETGNDALVEAVVRKIIDVENPSHDVGATGAATGTIKYDEKVYRGLITLLHAKGSHLPGAQSIIKGLLERVMTTTDLPTSATIVNLLDFCWEMDNANVCVLLCWRIITKGFLTIKSISNLLLPLIPELVSFVRRRNMEITSKPYSIVFMNIMFAWKSVALGTKPADPYSNLALLMDNPCPCNDCRSVMEFLVGDTVGGTLEVERIGALTRKHVEERLERYRRAVAVSVASWETIQTSRHGLRVSPCRLYIPVPYPHKLITVIYL